MNDKVDLYLPFEKKNNEEKTVEGFASTEALDSQGEVVKYTAIENALPDYMKFGNVREMHQASAVGKTVMAAVDKVKKGLWIKAKIVDKDAWEKVKEGVYNGFSIGGNIVSKIGNAIEELRLVEISVVDRPANPEALFSVVKFDGVKKDDMYDEEEDAGEIKMPPYYNIFTAARVLDLATQLVDLYDWYCYSKKDTTNIVGALESLKELAKQILNEAQSQKFDALVELVKAKEVDVKKNGVVIEPRNSADAFIQGIDLNLNYYLNVKHD
jgi:phage head maturation protease